MSLAPVRLPETAAAPPARVLRFLADVDARLDALVEAGLHERLPHFAPSDYPLVWRTLAAVADSGERRERFLEWGSALGAVAGMASALGFRASGIEIDAELADASRTLLARHGLSVEIVEGSFVPDGHEVPAGLDDPDTDNLAQGRAAYEELGRGLDEFRVVYAYPWPGLADAFFDLFDRHAAPGALLVTYPGRGGILVHRRT